MRNLSLCGLFGGLFFLAAGFGSVLAAEDYIVGSGDVLKITVYDHADLTTEVRVSGEGAITFPLVGDLRVGGLTISRVADTLTEKLADGFIVNPQVAVFVQEFRSKKATIMGEAGSPGLYELYGETTFLELLSKAGGLTPEAGDTAIIKRKNVLTGTTGIITVDLKKLVREGDSRLDVIILDGDSVYIGEASVFYITGEVNKPDAYKHEAGMTAAKAITLAGGLTKKAARDRVLIVRADGTEEVVNVQSGKGAQEALIQPGDSISVTEAGLVYVTGEVQRPGAYPWEQGMTFIKAVTLAGGFTDKASEGRAKIRRVVEGEEKVIKGVDFDDPVEHDDVILVPESFF